MTRPRSIPTPPTAAPLQGVLLTGLAMFAFAGNSLLCRLALKGTAIDAATFTLVRVVSAAVVLWLILRVRRVSPGVSRAMGGNWPSALALFAYAAAFSFAYVRLPAGTGALLLFGAVQATMIGYGLWAGERLRMPQWAGLLVALAGLVALLLPGLTAPPLSASLWMAGAGIAWGIYSLRGRRAADAVSATAGNFIRAAPMAVALSVLVHLAGGAVTFDNAGLLYAVISGAVTSGAGYVIWYAALRHLNSATAATVQLSVPVIAALGGVMWLGELLTPRLLASSVAILGGIALLIAKRKSAG
jgi:drug/metabolite transporter (DMT)-like permease